MNKHSRAASEMIIAMRIAAVPPPLCIYSSRVYRALRKTAEREERIYLREKCTQMRRRRRRRRAA